MASSNSSRRTASSAYGATGLTYSIFWRALPMPQPVGGPTRRTAHSFSGWPSPTGGDGGGFESRRCTHRAVSIAARKALHRGDFPARLGLVIAGPIAAAVAGAARWRESVLAESVIDTLMCGHVDTRGQTSPRGNTSAALPWCCGPTLDASGPDAHFVVGWEPSRSTPAALDTWQTPHQHHRWARHDFPRDDGA